MSGPDPSTPEASASDVGQVTVSVADAIARVRLDRPAKHNALTPEMLTQLEAILVRLDADRDVRVVVISGAGDRSFCAGADIHRFKALEPLDMWAQWTRVGHRVFDLLAGLRQPTIAAVGGNAYGGGFELALACDLRILSEDATLGLTEVGLGTVPGWGGTGRLRAQIGPARTKELIFTGTPLSAEQAKDWGVANLVVPRSKVADAAERLAAQIAGQAPISVQMAKQAIDNPDAFRAVEQIAGAATAFTDDAAEGFSSFTERRDPRFTGQ